MEVRPKIQSLDTSRISEDTSGQQSSVPSNPTRVNFGISRTQDSLESAKASPLDSLFAPAKPQIEELKEQVAEIEKAVLTAEAMKKKLEGIGEKIKDQGQLFGPGILQAIGNKASDGNDDA